MCATLSVRFGLLWFLATDLSVIVLLHRIWGAVDSSCSNEEVVLIADCIWISPFFHDREQFMDFG